MEDPIDSAVLDSEISMSIAATDETPEFHSQRRPYDVSGRIDSRAQAATYNEPNAENTKCCGRRFPMINVEPAIFLFALSFELVFTTQPLFLYWARCNEIFSDVENPTGRKINNVTDFCSHLSQMGNSTYQDVVEKDISTAKIFLQMASSLPTLIIAPIMGAWSDRGGGRRIPFLISLSGIMMYTLLELMGSLLYSYVNIYYLQFAAEFSIGCTGGVATVFGMSFAIVTDDSRDQMALGSSTIPLRIAIASALQAIGGLSGDLLASLCSISETVSAVAHSNGYVRGFAISAAFAVASFLYTLFCVRETHKNRKDDIQVSHRRAANYEYLTNSSSTIGRRGAFKCVRSFIYEIFEVTLLPRPGWGRFCLNLSACFFFVQFLALDNSLLFLLVKKYPFNWSDKIFTYYSVFKGITVSLGMLIVPFAIAKSPPCLGKDSLLIIIGVSASCAQFFIQSVAHSSVIIFLAGGCSLLAGAIAPGYRSFLPRLVAKEETARMFTVFSIVTVICPILANLLFNNIYNATIDVWPGFAFFVGAVLQLVVVIGQIIIHCLMRPQWIKENEDRNRLLSDEDHEDAGDSRAGPSPCISERSISNVAVNSDFDGGDYFEEPSRPLLA